HVAGYGSRLHLPRVVSGRQDFVPVDPVLRCRKSFRVAVGIGQGDLVLRSAAQVRPAEIGRALPDPLAVAGPHRSRSRIVERRYAVQQNIHHPVGVLVRNAGLGLGGTTRSQEKRKRDGANHGSSRYLYFNYAQSPPPSNAPIGLLLSHGAFYFRFWEPLSGTSARHRPAWCRG